MRHAHDSQVKCDGLNADAIKLGAHSADVPVVLRSD
jgi:hypothetical protein